ncbi:DNA-entry nuclease [Ligilactobacillus pabuli]|uniref:DNA-entry nuclease n=1 Tax=Ligilactobacillus pabuli TaxID=2886039 RepID=A0ABQ5JKS2_9LACO|nr:DNA/RNA non-specific endonuclease [Ligilactobacillus pabuli]GKS81842.1 DNA-entry nuclease [Ligilactobacillus pabuli]
MENMWMVLVLASLAYFIFSLVSRKRRKGKQKWVAVVVGVLSMLMFALTSPTDQQETADHGEKTEKLAEAKPKSRKQSSTKQNRGSELAAKKKQASQAAEKKKQAAKQAAEQAQRQSEKKAQQQQQAQAKQSNNELANLEFQGQQTITVNNNVPTFSAAEMNTTNGGWERYGDLDSLNRATTANALLNQSTMPRSGEKRGSISSVTPTGWKNKRIPSGYLFNRSHLIGWALSAENDNWRNLITGTRQLNSPEMLRFEMDTKTYLEQSSNNYVRYSVTPVFRGDELLARGVHMMAKSVGSNAISFNVFIFNVQDGVKLNYADGSSVVNNNAGSNTTAASSSATRPNNNVASSSQAPAGPQQNDQQNLTVYVTPTGSKYHLHPHGRGHFTPTTLKDAKARGLQPCKICNPPA